MWEWTRPCPDAEDDWDRDVLDVDEAEEEDEDELEDPVPVEEEAVCCSSTSPSSSSSSRCVELDEVASHALNTVCRLNAFGVDTPRRCVLEELWLGQLSQRNQGTAAWQVFVLHLNLTPT